MNTIHTDKAPAAVGPYSQAKVAGGFLFASGQVPLNPATGTVVDGDIQAQTEQVCKNIEAVLTEAGTSFDKVVKTTCFLADINDFKPFNEVYAKYFTSKPARSCVAVKDLPLGVSVEIEIIAEV
ncbi:RidA family protein [Veillonella caviae]|uniref:RidA family protein n=1 Tax=Veillonella caviae TaxID=248316 RepID=UPI000F8D6009|nr:RidA family protein [Veillonella caviae]MCI5708970.1 RidA family protein [Veillonella caviae]MCI6407681.1 RidA family protein [Veillonella caviae]MCI7693248.1 RidA family protein [Veillonella caviae]MDD7290909.1 RidA family protein [Veillonella caviae]MDY4746639.1 RidA family protein [Veillonella caviae]